MFCSSIKIFFGETLLKMAHFKNKLGFTFRATTGGNLGEARLRWFRHVQRRIFWIKQEKEIHVVEEDMQRIGVTGGGCWG